MMKLNINRADIKKNMRRFVALTRQILVQARPGELLNPAPFLEGDSSTYLVEKAQSGMNFLLKIRVTNTFYAIVNCVFHQERGEFGTWTCVADCLRQTSKSQDVMEKSERLGAYGFLIG